MKQLLLCVTALSLYMHAGQLTFSNNTKKKIHLIIKDTQTKKLLFEQDLDENNTMQAIHNAIHITLPEGSGSDVVQCIIRTKGNPRSAYKSRASIKYPLVWNGTTLCNDRCLQALEYSIQTAIKSFPIYDASE